MPCHGETYKNLAVRVLGGYAAIQVFLSKELLADIVLKGSTQRNTCCFFGISGLNGNPPLGGIIRKHSLWCMQPRLKAKQRTGQTATQLTVFFSKNESFCALVVSACHIPPLKRRRSIEFPCGPRFALFCFPARLHAAQTMFPDYSSQGWTPGFSFFIKCRWMKPRKQDFGQDAIQRTRRTCRQPISDNRLQMLISIERILTT